MLGTLKRAGDTLDLFTAEQPEWGVTACARRLGISKSLAHDVLASLAAIGLLQRVGNGHYRLGWRTISLASVLLRTSELKVQARPVVREVAERTGMVVALVAWDRARLVYVDRCGGARCTSPGPLPGSTVPLDGRAAANVLLAGRSREEVRSLWESGFVRTHHATCDQLECDLDRVRLHGWAEDDEDLEVAGHAIAAPVRDTDGDVTAAISLDLSEHGDALYVHRHARVAVAAAARISHRMRESEPAAAVR